MTKTATDLHKKWFDELTLELRLHRVTGAAIGDALASVAEFIVDSGQEPEDAFGTPRDYAARLAAEAPLAPRDRVRRQMILSTLGLVVFLIFSAAISPWSNSEPLLLGGTQLACFALLAALVLALPLYLNLLLRHMWALAALPLVGGAAGVLAALLQPREESSALLALWPLPVLLATAALMLVLAIVGTIGDLNETPDAISDPLKPARARTAWAPRLLAILPHWLFPVFGLLMLGLIALLDALV